jgi:aminopeptidase N
MGYPYLKVVGEKWTSDALEITLEQNWFLADGSALSAEESQKLWTIPLIFATSSSVSDSASLMSDKVQSFTIPLSGPNDWVKLNAGQQALVRVSCSPEMTNRLRGAIRSGALPAADRAAVLLDAYALAKAGFGSVEGVVDLLRAYDNESNATVWSAIQGVLLGLQLLMEEVGGEACAAFYSFASAIVKSALVKVGWDASPTDGHQEKLLRSTIIGLLDSFLWNDAAVASEARRRFDAHWTEPEALSSDYKVTVI